MRTEEQVACDKEQLVELEVLYKQAERTLNLIGERMREVKNRLQVKPALKYQRMDSVGEIYSPLTGGKYEK